MQVLYKYQSPYAHGIATAKYQADNPLSFFYNAYSTRAYRKTYSRPIPPISIEGLAVDINIKPPILWKQAGRPCTRRIRKGAWQRKQTRCGNCLDWGHNKKSCRGQPVSSGRRERARDWLAEEELGVNSDRDQGTDIEDEDKDKDNGEDNEDRDSDEDIEQEEEDQVMLSDNGSNQFEDTMDSDMTYDVIEVIPRV